MALTNRFYNLSCALGVARQSADNSHSLPQISMGCRKKHYLPANPVGSTQGNYSRHCSFLQMEGAELSWQDRNGWELKVHELMKSNKSGLQVTHVDDFANLICSLSGAAEMLWKTRLSSITPLLLNSVYFCFKTQVTPQFLKIILYLRSQMTSRQIIHPLNRQK